MSDIKSTKSTTPSTKSTATTRSTQVTKSTQAKTESTSTKTNSTQATTKPKTNKTQPVKPANSLAEHTVVELQVPWSEVEPIWQKQLRRLARHFKLTGFRPGKVPLHLVEQHLDPELLVHEIGQELTPPVASRHLEEKKVTVLGLIDAELSKTAKGVDWTIRLHFSEKPNLAVADYESIIKKLKPAIEKTLQAFIEASQPKKKTLTPAEIEELRWQSLQLHLALHYQPPITDLYLRQQTKYRLEKLGIEFGPELLQKMGEENFSQYLSEVFRDIQQQLTLGAILDQLQPQITEAELEAEQKKHSIKREELEVFLKVKKLRTHLLAQLKA